ncbi:MAG TPA: YhfT family protein [Erysipelotrichaceae bacterium]|nr:YhfT family protein [Erysipelotrichaceae bacterium]
MLEGYSIISVIVVIALCATTAFLSHTGAAVFHDGIRPVLPEYIEGRMKRPELASIAFGLSVGFIASVGIVHTVATNILNPWLLFLPTDILGIVAPRKWIAIALGALWGVLCIFGMGALNTALTILPVDMIGGIASLGNPVMVGFSLFPLVAIFRQFGTQKGVISTVLVLIVRQLASIFVPGMTDALVMLSGIILLLGFAISNDMTNKITSNEGSGNVFSERVERIKKNLPFLMLVGALVALASNLRIFAGSEVSIYTLAQSYATTGEAASTLVNQAALAEVMRGIGFIPLIAITAITTGVYGVAGLTFVYPIGYLMPNPIFALIGGAIMIFVEVMALGLVGKFLSKFHSIRSASDNIRSSMTTVMEFALLIGSVNACVTMGGATGFFIGAMVYFINEFTGKKIMQMAIGPVAAIVTGIVLNLMYFVGLFVI